MPIRWIRHVHENFFDFNLKCLLYIGLWPDEHWSNSQRLFYRIYELSFHVLSVIFLIITGIGTYEHRDQIIILLSNLDKTLVAYNFVLKVVFFVRKRDQVKLLIYEIIRSGDKVTEETKKLMKTHVILITIATTGVASVFSALALYNFEMTVEAWMPFDPMKNRMNLLSSAQILAFSFIAPCLYRNIAMQGMICSLLMYMCDQLIELQGRLKSLNYSPETEGEMRNTFKEIVKKHVRLIRYSKSMEKAFGEFFMIQNLAVTVELCLNAVMVSMLGVNEKKHLVTFLSFLCVALVNAYIYCYLGNEMITQSQRIATAAYDTSWTSWPVDLQKDLLLVIRAAQKPLKLSAGGVAPISIQTFSQTLYNGYSIFAFLNDVVD